MSKEKLTVEEVIQELIRDGWMGKDNFINLLEQIKSEILMNYNGITDGGKIREIDMVFNKYLNEK